MKRSALRLLLALGAQASVATVALAAEAEEHDTTATFLGMPTWIWMSANLALFLWLLWHFVGPPVLALLEERGKTISDSLQQAAQQKLEANEMKASLEAQIAELRAEMDEIVARAKQDGETERQEILAQAERERERLLEQTQEEIKLRVAQAQAELTAYTAQLAAELAREKLTASIATDDADRLFDENLDRLEREIQ